MSESFSDGATTPEATTETNVEQQEKNYLEELVGDGKKFQSVEEGFAALAKKAEHADTFIETLKTEKQQLEQQFNEQTTKSRTVDEIVELLRPQETTSTVVSELPKSVETSKGLTLEDVQKYLEEERMKTSAKQKAKQLWTRLSSEDVFGSTQKAKEAVAKYIGGDTTKKALVDQMAMYDPSGLELLLKASVKPENEVSFMETSSSEKNSENFTPSSDKLTWDIVRKVRKENPKLYNSKAFKQRMHSEL